MQPSDRRHVDLVFGTRPEAIKMAPLALRFREFESEFAVRIIVTAQHREMLDQVMDIFSLESDIDLQIMRPGQSLTDVTVNGLRGLEGVLNSEPSDLVLVHGDTTTTLAASLAAFYQQIPVGHVEAGLRSFDKRNPYPEEINRTLCDSISELHFVPTETARANLRREGRDESSIFTTGNTGLDGLRLALERVGDNRKGPTADLAGERYVLITAHRRENFGEPIQNFCAALKAIAGSTPDVHFVYPVHPNPNVHGPVHESLAGLSNVHLLEPLDYLDFVALLRDCHFVITDSGGIQEEAPSLGKPVLVFRKVTERPEAVTAGTVQIMGTDRNSIERWIRRLLTDDETYTAMANAVNPYGDGYAADRTVEAIRFFFGFREDRPPPFGGDGQ